MRKTLSPSLGFILLACGTACQSGIKDQSFTHNSRVDYAISDEEFKSIDFTISAEVMAHAVGEVPEYDRSGSGVVIAPKGTNGSVVAVGPDWLRVTFGLGGGAFFKTDTTKAFDNYWLATEVEGEEGLFMLKDLPKGVLHIEGSTYNVTRGSTAYLRVDVDSWRKFTATRTHAPGT
jgi:hypothetical protein